MKSTFQIILIKLRFYTQNTFKSILLSGDIESNPGPVASNSGFVSIVNQSYTVPSIGNDVDSFLILYLNFDSTVDSVWEVTFDTTSKISFRAARNSEVTYNVPLGVRSGSFVLAFKRTVGSAPIRFSAVVYSVPPISLNPSPLPVTIASAVPLDIGSVDLLPPKPQS